MVVSLYDQLFIGFELCQVLAVADLAANTWHVTPTAGVDSTVTSCVVEGSVIDANKTVFVGDVPPGYPAVGTKGEYLPDWGSALLYPFIPGGGRMFGSGARPCSIFSYFRYDTSPVGTVDGFAVLTTDGALVGTNLYGICWFHEIA